VHAPEVVKRFAAAYHRASKKGRGEVLDAVVAATGYSRAHASFLVDKRGFFPVGDGPYLPGRRFPYRWR